MPTQPSTAKRLRTLLDAIEVLHSHEAGPFGNQVLTACQQLFPGVTSSLELWDLTSGVHEGALDGHYDPKDINERFQRIGELAPKQHPGFPLVTAGMSDPIRLSDHTSLRQFRKRELYEIAFKPVDAVHQVIAPLRSATHLGGLTFNRGGQKDFTLEDMELIRILGRHTMMAHHVSRVLAAAASQRAKVARADHTPLRRAGLTRRESEVLQWMAQGKRDREIAVILGISHRTVEKHVAHILATLGAENRTAAIVLAMELGLIPD